MQVGISIILSRKEQLQARVEVGFVSVESLTPEKSAGIFVPVTSAC